MWEIAYVAYDCENNTMTIEGHISLCNGLCFVLAGLPMDEGNRAFESLATKSLDRLDLMVSKSERLNDFLSLGSLLPHIAYEIRLLSTMTRSFTNARQPGFNPKEHGCNELQNRRSPVQQQVLDIIKRGWRNITYTAIHWSSDKVSIIEYPFVDFHFSKAHVFYETEHCTSVIIVSL